MKWIPAKFHIILQNMFEEVKIKYFGFKKEIWVIFLKIYLCLLFFFI